MDSYKIIRSEVADGHEQEMQVAEVPLNKSEKPIEMRAVVDTFQNHRMKFVFLTWSCMSLTVLVVN